MTDSDSSGTLSSAGGDDSNEDAFDEKINTNGQRDSILGGKLAGTRRLSTTSSNFYSHYSESGMLHRLAHDNKSDDSDDSDGVNVDGIGELDAQQLLEQEHEKLQFFNESLCQCQKLSLKMNGVLQNLQDKLKKLQTTLDPIRRDTTQVATAEKNINKTMNELHRVMEYHKLTTEPLASIKKKTLKASSGLVDESANNQDFNDDEWNDPFLIWIEKINEAKNYFEKNRFKSSAAAIHNLGNIAEIALDRMESYFRDLLKQHTTRNKRVINEIINYQLLSDWRHRNVAFPLWSNKLMKNEQNQNNIITDLLYIPYRVIKLLANVALRIEQTASVHNLKDKLGELVISPRSNLLFDILKSLNYETLLTIMYIHAYYNNAMKNQKAELFRLSNKKRDSISIEAEAEEEEDEEKKVGVLSADALNKLNALSGGDSNVAVHAGNDAVVSNVIAADLVLIDIKSESHPIILYLHIGLSLFQLERHLCSTILDVKNEVLLEFDEFFNEVISEPLQLMIEAVETVLSVKDIMAVTRNAQISKGGLDKRRVSFNQMNALHTNPNISLEEAAKITAKSTAKAAIINDSIHKNMILVKLALVDCWMKLYPAFDKILNQSKDYGPDIDDNDNAYEMDININMDKRGMAHLARLGDKLYLNCASTLEERVRQIHQHTESKNVRIDGGYHPLTIETVKLMFGVYEYREALQHLYDTQKSVSPMKILVNNNRQENDKRDLRKRQIEKTLVDIVKALRHNIKLKSVQYGANKKTLEAIFMLNNLHYIVRTIGDTELEIACGQQVVVSLQNDINKYKTRYEQATWEKVKEYINLSKLRTDFFTDKAANLSSKEKKPIKQRFAGFNKEFELQLNTQSFFSVPDTNLRLELINRNIDIVLPMYRIFVGKFKNIEFTKDRGKYHKYDEKTLHDKMHQFFQQN